MSGSILGKRLREERGGNTSTQGMVFHETAIVAVKGSSLWEDLGMWEAGENDGEIDERRPMGKGILMNSVGKNALHFEEGVFREYLHSTAMMTPTKRFMALKALSVGICLLYTSPSPRDKRQSRMPSSA